MKIVSVVALILASFVVTRKHHNTHKTKGSKQYDETCNQKTFGSECQDDTFGSINLTCQTSTSKCKIKSGNPCVTPDNCFSGKCKKVNDKHPVGKCE
jgi:hypothetical protein